MHPSTTRIMIVLCSYVFRINRYWRNVFDERFKWNALQGKPLWSMMTNEKYEGLKQQHPVFALIDRASNRITHGLQIFVGSRLVWLATIIPTCVLPSPGLLCVLRHALKPLGLASALPLRVSQVQMHGHHFSCMTVTSRAWPSSLMHDRHLSQVVQPRLLAAGACMAITSLRQILQSTYISPNGNNFGTSAALLVGISSRSPGPPQLYTVYKMDFLFVNRGMRFFTSLINPYMCIVVHILWFRE